jgi:hypothetical protein
MPSQLWTVLRLQETTKSEYSTWVKRLIALAQLAGKQCTAPDNHAYVSCDVTPIVSKESLQSIVPIYSCLLGRSVASIVCGTVPHYYLKDGTVRQHDLRTPHICPNLTCPAPLVKVNHELSTMSLSPLTPYQFVVAGEAPYVRDSYRWLGTQLKTTW